MPEHDKILNLMQFARKAGKVVGGSDACQRGINRGHIHLIIVANDIAPRSLKRIQEYSGKVKILQSGEREKISAALGMPITAVFGISDKNFAAKMLEYWQN